jgi:hypothetical protein
MNELEKLLTQHGLQRALELHPRVPVLDVATVERCLQQRDEQACLLPAAADGLLKLARERLCGLLLDEAFVEAGCDRALEPHARLELQPIPLLWGLAQRGEMASVLNWARQRHQEIELEEQDRFRYGWRGDPRKSRQLGGGWKRAIDAINAVKKVNPRYIPKILCMGGNGSSKSEFGAWWAINLMVEKPGTQVAVLCPSQTQARKVLMSRMFDNLPKEWRPAETGKVKSGITGNISYTRKMGFTENMFILPNGSRCTFYFYLEGDVASIEGDQLDLVLADEEVPVEWLEAVEYRLARTGGTLIAMFTPISGYIPAVRWFRGKARLIEEARAPLLKTLVTIERNERGELQETRSEVPAWFDGPAGAREEPVMMPLAEYGDDPTKRIVYFWTQDCCYPAGGYETLVELMKNKRAGLNEVKTRAYGWPATVRDARFPILSERAHAIHPDRAAAGEVPQECSWYHCLDPANARNHVMQWYAKTRDGREILVREWPQQDDYIPAVGMPGPWAVDSKKGKAMDGVPGPAQESWGLTTEQYVEEIKRIEIELARVYEKRTDGQPITVTRRIMDSRGGDTVVHGRTYFTEFARCGMRFTDASGKALNARSDNPDAVAGVSLITDALGYDTQKPLGPSNRPRLMIVYAPANIETGETVPHGCANSWDALQNWTGADGLKGARKDWIDLFHYAQRAVMRFIDHAARAAAHVSGQWGGY